MSLLTISLFIINIKKRVIKVWLIATSIKKVVTGSDFLPRFFFLLSLTGFFKSYLYKNKHNHVFKNRCILFNVREVRQCRESKKINKKIFDLTSSFKHGQAGK